VTLARSSSAWARMAATVADGSGVGALPRRIEVLTGAPELLDGIDVLERLGRRVQHLAVLDQVLGIAWTVEDEAVEGAGGVETRAG
jgi:hypothetical protein